MWTSRNANLTSGLKSARGLRGDMRLATPQQRGASNRRGFTLVEILASIAVLLMFMALLGQMVNSATKAWGLGTSNTERLQNIRAITDFIGGELQAALIPSDPSSQTSLQFVLNPSGTLAISGSIYGNRDALFWQAPLATDQRLGEIAEIGYFVHWDLTTKSSNPRAQLCRFFVNPVQSGTTGPPAAESNFLIYTTPNGWLSDDIIKSVVPVAGPPSSTSLNSYQGLFAENVIGLWVRCFDSAGTEISADANGVGFSSDFPSRTGYDSRRGYYDSTDTDPAHRTIKRLPAIVELSIVMVDSNAAARITPAMQQAIVSLYQNATDADGNRFDGKSFVKQAQKDPRFQPIKSSLRSCQTRIFLQNYK